MIKANEISLPVTLASSLVVFALGYALIRMRRKRDYERVAKVVRLQIYPIKSLNAIEVDHLDICKTGSRYGKYHDRSYILIKSNERFINRGQVPELTTITQSFEGDQLVVVDKHGNRAVIPLKESLSPSDRVVELNGGMYGQDMKGIDCGDEVAEFFSRALGSAEGVRLLQYVPSLPQRISWSKGKREKDIESKYPILYQDFSSLHLCTLPSLKDLNEKITKNSGSEFCVDNTRFRPNVIVEECKAWEEDEWLHIKFPTSGAQLYQLQQCVRCANVTVDDKGGEFTKEPMKTLRMFRKGKFSDDIKRSDGKPLFGSIFSTEAEGTIRLGDEIYAIKVDRI